MSMSLRRNDPFSSVEDNPHVLATTMRRRAAKAASSPRPTPDCPPQATHNPHNSHPYTILSVAPLPVLDKTHNPPLPCSSTLNPNSPS